MLEDTEKVVLPNEKELESGTKSASGFENPNTNVMGMVVGREISERLSVCGEPDCDILRKVVD